MYVPIFNLSWLQKEAQGMNYSPVDLHLLYENLIFETALMFKNYECHL